MLSFTSYITEQKNTHLTHVEDAVIYGGVNGARQAITSLQSIRDMLAGHKEGKVSVKWDGAPAIFAGIDPSDGKFFVAKKGIFNKNPKIYKTESQIDSELSGELASKFKDALRYLPELGIKGVIQGDFLFSQSDLKREKIDGEQYVTFHPNTIVYAVPVKSAQSLTKAKLGIVWHTTYTGDTFETMTASFGVDMSKLKHSNNVWSQDAMLKDLTSATLTVEESKEISQLLSFAGRLFQDIAGNVLRTIENNPILAQHIEQYNNIYVRKGAGIKDTKQHVERLVSWIHAKYEKEASTKKSITGKSAVNQKREALLSFFSNKNKVQLKKIFDLQKLLVQIKLRLIPKLNKLTSAKTFVRTGNGFKVTGSEGFVAIDSLTGGALKLVDRMEFSHNNFNTSIIKGWQSPSRN